MGARPIELPGHLAPMLASVGKRLPEGAGWAYEIKWDGVRALAYRQSGRLRLEGRNRVDITARYPELQALGEQLGEHDAVLDGEIVAFDEQGRPSFERLQQRMHLSSQHAIARAAREVPVAYEIFDLLHLDGRPTLELPYGERRELLQGLKLNGPAWQTPSHHAGNGRDFLSASAEHGLEGVVAKDLRSPYRPGRRSASWVKVKNMNRQELVIGGFLEGKGQRGHSLGALLLGYYEKADEDAAGEEDSAGDEYWKGGEDAESDEDLGDGEDAGSDEAAGNSGSVLRYAGRVGTGFDERELERLTRMLASRRRRSSPFARRGVQPPREARFVKPDLVAEVEFSEWTRARQLRQPSYKGLRDDKPATEVRMERARRGRRATQRPFAARDARGKRPPAAARGARDTRPAPRRRSETQRYKVVRETKRHAEIEVDGRTLRLSNREKVLYPATGFTKGQLIDYYAAIAPVLLGHLAGRPLTLKRYPDGVEGEHFYEKRCPAHRPDWVQTAAIWSGHAGEEIDYCLVEDLPTLMWVANLASVELHTSLSRATGIDSPSWLVFDLDPGPPAGLRACCRVALLIRELLDSLGLQALAKTSGSKGLQVYLPLNTSMSYEQTKPFARAVAELLERQHPKLAVSRMTTRLRASRVLIDWSQNDPHKTTVCVYSLRAREHPTISTPLTWEEIERAACRRREPELSLEPRAMLKRVERHGDLFAPLLDLTQELPDLSRAGAGR